MTFTIDAPVRLDQGRATSDLRWAEIAGKRVFVLRQRGSFADCCYDHGALLADQIQTGVFPEILDTIQTGTDVGEGMLSWIPSAIYRRMSDEVFAACSDEFRDGAQALGDGIFDVADAPRFNAQDVRDAVVAIDVGNCAEGLTRRVEKWGAPENSGTIGYVLGAARRYRRGSSSYGLSDEISRNPLGVSRAIQRLVAPNRRIGFGCTAAGAAPTLTADGRGLHARTFDAAFFAWNAWPGIFLIDERATNPAWHRFVAIGTAGLTYPGGISGANEAGLAASIHQMSTVRYDTGRPGRGHDIAPFLQQRILRECANLDQGHALLDGARHFGSWTIVVSDAKTGQSARFELNGGTQTATRGDAGDRFVQTNHFLAEATRERNDFFEDLHFTPTFGKWLETRARMATAEAWLDRGGLDTDAAIGLMSGHGDGLLSGALRSFGRTVPKAYGLMASIARPDPDRARGDDQLWFSVGNAQPGPHAEFAGFAVDWAGFDLAPVADRAVRTPYVPSPDFAAACAAYVQAFALLSRPRDATEAYLGRDPEPAEYAALLDQAIALIAQACQRVEDAGETDFALRYALARLRHQAGHLDAAAADLDFLRALADAGGFAVHDFERALVLIVSAATDFARGATASAQDHLAAGAALLDSVRAASFPAGARVHPDLDKWTAVIEDLRSEGAGAALPVLDMVTVE